MIQIEMMSLRNQEFFRLLSRRGGSKSAVGHDVSGFVCFSLSSQFHLHSGSNENFRDGQSNYSIV